MNNLDFDVEHIREHKINLFDCQIDIILKSLQLYSFTYKFVVPHKKPQNREEDLRISLVRDTYEQIISTYVESKKDYENYDIEKFIKNA